MFPFNFVLVGKGTAYREEGDLMKGACLLFMLVAEIRGRGPSGQGNCIEKTMLMRKCVKI